MDILLFVLILTVWYALVQHWSRARVAPLWTAALAVTVLSVRYLAAASFDLGF